MAAIASHFQPRTTSFGQLTLRHTQSRNRVNLAAHRHLIIGWAFAAVFVSGLGCLYALDQAVFAYHDHPVAYSGVMLETD